MSELKNEGNQQKTVNKKLLKELLEGLLLVFIASPFSSYLQEIFCVRKYFLLLFKALGDDILNAIGYDITCPVCKGEVEVKYKSLIEHIHICRDAFKDLSREEKSTIQMDHSTHVSIATMLMLSEQMINFIRLREKARRMIVLFDKIENVQDKILVDLWLADGKKYDNIDEQIDVFLAKVERKYLFSHMEN